MSLLYVYALLEARAPVGGQGLWGEELRRVDLGELAAAVGECPAPPSLERRALQGHEQVVRRLWEVSEAILPARFGGVVEGEERLRETLAPRLVLLGAALELVRGREQMTLRLFGDETRAGAPGDREDSGEEEPLEEREAGPGAGPGTRHLLKLRRAAASQRSAPELEPLRAVLSAFVAAERIERNRVKGGGESSVLLLTAYHLIPRGKGEAYARAVEGAAAAATLRVRVSGPWPPYAFSEVEA